MISLLRCLSVVGCILFFCLLISVVFFPKAFERSALGFVKSEIQSGVNERYPMLNVRPVATGLKKLSKSFGDTKDGVAKNIEQGVPEYISKAISVYCGCEKETQRTEAIKAGMVAKMERLGIAQAQLTDFIKGQYDATIAALRSDLTIFLSTNLIAFAFVLAASFVPPARRGVVVIPGFLLVTSVVISVSLYLFNTDWFYTILFRDYAGNGYAIGMLVIFGLLIDIVMNRARVCLKIASNIPAPIIPSC